VPPKRQQAPNPAWLTVSIALATFNGARFLSTQLASFLKQTRPPDELLVGDDGSVDATLPMLEAFAREAPFPVTITRNPQRLGFSQNFLSVAARCRGDVVAFSDQDDVWHPNKLSRCLQILEDHPKVRHINHRARVIDQAGRPVGRSFPELGSTRLVHPLGMDPWTPAYGLMTVARRDIVDLAVRLPRPLSFDLDGHPMNHDEWTAFLARSLFDVVVLNEDLVDYREHPTNVIGPPVGGPIERAASRLGFGPADYLKHAHLYGDFRRFWERAADEPGLDAAACRLAAARFGSLESLALAAAHARRPGRPRFRQVPAVAGLALRGTYRSRARGGLGAMAFARDVLATALGFEGLDGNEVPEEVLDRMIAEREAGRSFRAIAEDLHREGIRPPMGGRWRATTVSHLAYRRRSQLDAIRQEAADEPG
jgi:glycosyltransferase involved in cell wall biosynthesis